MKNPTPPENKESARESDSRTSGHSNGGEMCGSSNKHGIRFPVHDHHDVSNVKKGMEKL